MLVFIIESLIYGLILKFIFSDIIKSLNIPEYVPFIVGAAGALLRRLGVWLQAYGPDFSQRGGGSSKGGYSIDELNKFDMMDDDD